MCECSDDKRRHWASLRWFPFFCSGTELSLNDLHFIIIKLSLRQTPLLLVLPEPTPMVDTAKDKGKKRHSERHASDTGKRAKETTLRIARLRVPERPERRRTTPPAQSENSRKLHLMKYNRMQGTCKHWPQADASPFSTSTITTCHCPNAKWT